MASIAEETASELVSTNVVDSTKEFDTTKLTVSAHLSNHSSIIKNGTLWTSGDNTYGQCGLGHNNNVEVFNDTGITDVKSVFNGRDITFIIKNDNTLWVTGRGTDGRTGLGHSNDVNVFTDTGIADVKSVASGLNHTLIIKLDGTLMGTGSDTLGQLGLLNKSKTVFTPISITDVKFVSVGFAFSFIILEDNSVWSTGLGLYGATGLGDILNKNTFTDTGKSYSQVQCGLAHTVAIDLNGDVHTTGLNADGQAGLGTTTTVNIFTDVGVSNVKSISAGDKHTFIVINDNTLFVSGDNSKGQSGLGATVSVSIFTDTGVTGVDASFAGAEHSLIIKSSVPYSTGLNSSGQLALDDLVDRNIFETTAESVDTFVAENWTPHYPEEIVKSGRFRYVVALPTSQIPNIYTAITKTTATNDYMPFDGKNITPAISSSPMIYKIIATEEFNSFTLAKVLATSVNYKIRSSNGTLIKEDDITIDCKRDAEGILSLYPTTVVFYADQQMETGSTVEITLTHSDEIQLGGAILNNSIDAGFTNLQFSHEALDYNENIPDDWGNIPEGNKARVTVFNITVDIYISRYSYAVSFHESIRGKNVTIDGSDNNGQVADEKLRFGSMVRRVRISNVKPSSIVKDGELYLMAKTTIRATEVV